MAIDLKKMKEKLTAVQTGKSGGGGSKFWRPEDGTQTIRIVPTEDGDPFKEFHFHYNVGKNAGFLCPKKNFNDDCPVCNFAFKLYNEGTDDSKNMAKKFFARQRFFSPVVVRGEEDKGVRIWGYGKMAYASLLELVLNAEYGDITSVSEGTDLGLTYGKVAGASFPSTKITPSRKTSTLCADLTEEQCNEMVESQPEIDSVFERVTTTDAQNFLDEFLSTEESAEGSSTETWKFSATPANEVTGTGDTTTTVAATTSNPIEEAFSELMS